MIAQEKKDNDLQAKLKERWALKKAEKAEAPATIAHIIIDATAKHAKVANPEPAAQNDQPEKQKRASLSSVLAKHLSDDQKEKFKSMKKALNKDIIESLATDIKVGKLAKSQINQKSATPVHTSSVQQPVQEKAELKTEDLKGVTGGDLNDLVQKDQDQLWTSDGIQVVDKFLGSSFRHA